MYKLVSRQDLTSNGLAGLGAGAHADGYGLAAIGVARRTGECTGMGRVMPIVAVATSGCAVAGVEVLKLKRICRTGLSENRGGRFGCLQSSYFLASFFSSFISLTGAC